ncbi:MAG: radical SAM protein [Coriobacteriales bacterium]
MDASACAICPRCCAVDRARERGVCGEGDTVRLARAALHFWEEPPISGEAGSGTVFFSGCPLRCAYCQNKDIARGEIGRGVSIERLARIFLEQQERGALNINLVTPTHFAPQVKAALDLAHSHGFSSTPLTLPVVYNTSGYELSGAIAALDGYVDVFLTDFKYASPELARRYSAAPDYPEIAVKALDAMFELVGPLAYDETERERSA